MTTGGNVGIGTTSPSQKLDVSGNIAVSGTVDGVDIATNIPSSLGTAGQVLTVNAGATAGEWADAGGGGGGIGGIDTKVQGYVGNTSDSIGATNYSVSIPSGATIAMLYWNFRGGESNGGSGGCRIVGSTGTTNQIFYGSSGTTGSGVVWYNISTGTYYVEGSPVTLGSSAFSSNITVQVYNYTSGRRSRINSFEVYFD